MLSPINRRECGNRPLVISSAKWYDKNKVMGKKNGDAVPDALVATTSMLRVYLRKCVHLANSDMRFGLRTSKMMAKYPAYRISSRRCADRGGIEWRRNMISVNLFVPDSERALAFYERAFGATAEKTLFDVARGEKAARFYIGSDRFAIADENSMWGSKSPLTLGGAPLCIQLFVDDLQKTVDQAVATGTKVVSPGTEEQPIFLTPDGIQCCNLADPFGFIWSVSSFSKHAST